MPAPSGQLQCLQLISGGPITINAKSMHKCDGYFTYHHACFALTCEHQSVAMAKSHANECQNIMRKKDDEKQTARGVSRGDDQALDHQRRGDDERDSTRRDQVDC